MGKIVKMSFEGQTCRKWANELKIEDSEKNLDPRGGCAPTPGAIYMYVTIIFVDSFSKTAWPIKVKFYRKHLYEGATKIFINKPGHSQDGRNAHIW